MYRRVNYSGLIVAGIGFFLTRFTVTLAVYEDPLSFYLGGIVPLALGLGLAAFGVALTVADIDPSLVRTTAIWCVVGAGTMLCLVILTLLGSNTASGGLPDLSTVRSQAYLSNFLIGGSVGGTLTGLYAARTRRQRQELQHQANSLVVLNQLLRHEILNAIQIIQGYAETTSVDDATVQRVIKDQATIITQSVDGVREFTRRTGRSEKLTLKDCLSQSIETVTDRHPAASISADAVPESVLILGDPRLTEAFTHLLENAIVHGGDQSPTVDVTMTGTSVRVRIADAGAGLSQDQQALLETGDITAFDNPGTGFGLSMVQLLVADSNGTIETTVDDTGTTITVVLPRAAPEESGLPTGHSTLVGIRPAVPELVVAVVAAVIAGIFYGVSSEVLGGSVAGIGVFYGTPDVVVGWLTHLFHSIVFGFVFVGIVSRLPARYRARTTVYVAVGIGWGIVLWVFAAGLIAPFWLRLLGIPVSIPSFSGVLLVNHVVWGISLSLLTVWGDRYVSPWLAQISTLSR